MKIKDIYNHEEWEKIERRKSKKFIFDKRIYLLGNRKSEIRRFINIEISTLWGIFKQITSSSIVLIIMFFISSCFDRVFIYFGWKKTILQFIYYDRQMFINFLISTISIAGFLIALFYANLSGIFASRYAHISSRVSRELLNERTNKTYFKSITNYIIVVLLVLILNITGINTGLILAILIVFFTIRIIVIFIELSKRIFMYSDIVIIGRNASLKIYEIIEKIQISHFKYDDQSFQKHHRVLALNNIDILSDLSDSLIKDSDVEGLAQLLVIDLYLIVNYSKDKNKIPYNSLWFPKINKQKIWFKESDLELITAINHGIQLTPNSVIDEYFFENKLVEVNLKILNFLFENSKTKNLYKYFELYHQFLTTASKSADIEFWYNNIQDNVRLIVDYLVLSPRDTDEYGLGLLDMISLYQIDYVIEFSSELLNQYDKIQKIKYEEISTEIVLNLNCHFMNNEYFSEFIKKLERERFVEGEIVTPNKIILEYILYQFSKEISELTIYITKTMVELQDISNRFVEKKMYLHAAMISSRIIELFNKIVVNFDLLEDMYNDVVKSNLENYEFNKIDFNKIMIDLKSIYINNIEKFSEIAISLFKEGFDIESNNLDFIGQAYYQLTFSLLEIIFEDDYESFDRLYPLFYNLCLISDSYIRDIVSLSYRPEYVADRYTMSFINFMNISGFAMYYSHLKEDFKWEERVLKFTESLLYNDDAKEEIVIRFKTYAEIKRQNEFHTSFLESSIRSSIERFIDNSKLIKFKMTGDLYLKTIDSDDELIQKFSYSDSEFSYQFYEIYLYYCINGNIDKVKRYETQNGWAERSSKNG